MPNAKEVGLRSSTLQELFNTNFPNREYLLEPWLKQETPVLLWAPTGVGKTMLSLSIALAVAGGGELLGWKAAKSRKVLIVDGEMHIEDLTERSKMLADTVEGIDKEAAVRNTTILARQYQKPDSKFPDLATEDGQRVVLEMIQEGDFELVILDNFSTLAMVEDENSASAMNPIIEFLMKMKQAKVACVLVHHSGKGEGTYRGSSKLETTFEVTLGLRKLEGLSYQHTAAFELRWDKYRGKRNDATTSRKVWLEVDSGVPQWMYQETEDNLCGRLVDAVRSCEYRTQVELGEALGIKQKQVSLLRRQAIHQLKLISEQEWKDCLSVAKDAEGEPEDDF